MAVRFSDFELDEDRREFRLGGREIAVQPRVFDLLAYLINNHHRVVTKEELLQALWPGTVVVDGALQRVVSLARSALAEGGAREAIRTYARYGYRFCHPAIAVTEPDFANPARALERARRAFNASSWEFALAAFREADAERPLAAVDLERWAQAAQWTGNARSAVEPLERAVSAHLGQGDRQGAARAALHLAQIAFERMELSVAGGWQRRAGTLLRDAPACRETGLLRFVGARIALFQGAMEAALAQARAAHRIGVALGDADLEGLGLLYIGHALLALGEVERGVESQNEAAAAVLAGETSAWAGALVYCGVIWACRNRADWGRAAEWTERFGRWCEQRRMAAYPGTCRLHRAEVLTVRGRVEDALREIEESAALASTWAPWAEGDAYRVLGDLRLLQGELDEAESAYQRARELNWDPQPGYAALLAARGQPQAAVRTLESSVADGGWVNRERRGILLAHLACACARAGRVARARDVLEALEAQPALWRAPAAEAVVLQARAELAAAEGRREEAIATLGRALAVWRQAEAPLHAAHLRLRLAELLTAAGDVQGLAELRVAEGVFAAHGAPALAAHCRRSRLEP